ncbi:MAG: type IV secretion system DNA-binding domain-containing protein [Patescibacteria group bacterium]|nr:type IV secretion system DNA-binding domain-containing protein [Patescibacteria group bacterium]MDE1946224.1 type IV secretion system DNA-binding domain-containing protein [Patescibacteria group bacterium]
MNPERITYFGETDSRNKRVKFGIKAKDRTKHVYAIGKTGMGKSTLLENMAIQDLANGEGMAFLDPHGKTAELLLDFVPAERINDVVYFAPFDTDYPISFNVMEDVGADKRHLVVSGLMSAFKKLFGEESFSDRMQYILQNTILALLEYPGATMLGINRMLTDKAYRAKVVANVTDMSVKSYWTQEFANYTERFAAEAVPAIQNKIGQFTANPLIRNIIGQPKSSFDFRKIMDDGKIMIINLSKGRVGEANANLLGSMLITKIYLAAMSRADIPEKRLKLLPNFYLYVDEFQSFANESFADILSEARKYKLNLTIAHQYIEQMSEEVRAAVFGNVGTMIAFRVGAYDAEVLEKEFAPQFTAEDLVNLGIYQMYLKLMIDGVSSFPFSATGLPPFPEPVISYKKEIIEQSRAAFTVKKSAVEAAIQAWYDEGKPAPKPAVEKKTFAPKPAPIEMKADRMPTPAPAESKVPENNPPAPRPVRVPVERPRVKPDMPPIETEVGGDFVTLADFAKKTVEPKAEKKPASQQKSKEMTNENLSSLRSALAAAMQQEPSKEEGKRAEKPAPAPTKRESAEPKPKEPKLGSAGPAEIAEADLRKILDLDK